MPDLSQLSDAQLQAQLAQAKAQTQSAYDVLNENGVWKQQKYQAVGHNLRAQGMVSDPTQGGIVNPNPSQQQPQPQASAAPPQQQQAPVPEYIRAANARFNNQTGASRPTYGNGGHQMAPVQKHAPAPEEKPSVLGFGKNLVRNFGETVYGLGAFPVVVAQTAAKGVQSGIHSAAATYYRLRGDTQNAHLENELALAVNESMINTGKQMLGGDDGIIGHSAQIAGYMQSYFDGNLSVQAQSHALHEATRLANAIAPGILRKTYHDPVEQVLNVLMVGEAGAGLGAMRASRLSAAAKAAATAGDTAKAARLTKAAEGMMKNVDAFKQFSNRAQNMFIPDAAKFAEGKLLGKNAKYQGIKAAVKGLAETPMTKAGIHNTVEGLKSKAYIEAGQGAAKAAQLGEEIRTAARVEQRAANKAGRKVKGKNATPGAVPHAVPENVPGVGPHIDGSDGGAGNVPGTVPPKPPIDPVEAQADGAVLKDGKWVNPDGTEYIDPEFIGKMREQGMNPDGSPIDEHGPPQTISDAAPATPAPATAAAPVTQTDLSKMTDAELQAKLAEEQAKVAQATAAPVAETPGTKLITRRKKKTSAPVETAPAEPAAAPTGGTFEKTETTKESGPVKTQTADEFLAQVNGDKTTPADAGPKAETEKPLREIADQTQFDKIKNNPAEAARHQQVYMKSAIRVHEAGGLHSVEEFTALREGVGKILARDDYAPKTSGDRRKFDAETAELMGKLEAEFVAKGKPNATPDAVAPAPARTPTAAERKLGKTPEGLGDDLVMEHPTTTPAPELNAHQKHIANELAGDLNDTIKKRGSGARGDHDAQTATEWLRENYDRPDVLAEHNIQPERALQDARDLLGGDRVNARLQNNRGRNPADKIRPDNPGTITSKGEVLPVTHYDADRKQWVSVVDKPGDGGRFPVRYPDTVGASGKTFYGEHIGLDISDWNDSRFEHPNGEKAMTPAKARQAAGEVSAPQASAPEPQAAPVATTAATSEPARTPTKAEQKLGKVDPQTETAQKTDADTLHDQIIAHLETMPGKIDTANNLRKKFNVTNGELGDVVRTMRKHGSGDIARGTGDKIRLSDHSQIGEGFRYEHPTNGETLQVTHAFRDAEGNPVLSQARVKDGEFVGNSQVDPLDLMHETGKPLSRQMAKDLAKLYEENGEAVPQSVKKSLSLFSKNEGERHTTAETPVETPGEKTGQAAKAPKHRAGFVERVQNHVKNHVALAERVKFLLDKNLKVEWRELDKMADHAFGGTQVEGKYNARDMYDAVEAAVNQHIAETIPNLFDLPVDEALAKLRAVMDNLPAQTKRTEAQVSMQQFSTPPTEAYIAVKALGDLHGKTVLEPSAGTGSLANMARLAGAEVLTNEHVLAESHVRAGLLDAQGFEVTRRDAERLDAYAKPGEKYDAVIMNPPFSSTGGRTKNNKTSVGASHVEAALALLKDDGRLVAIVGGGMGHDSPTHSAWFSKMEKEGAILRANLLIEGKEYHKYGTDFDNRVLVFDKTMPEGAKARPDLFIKHEASRTMSGGSPSNGISVDEAARRIEGLGNERGNLDTTTDTTGNRTGTTGELGTRGAGLEPSGERSAETGGRPTEEGRQSDSELGRNLGDNPGLAGRRADAQATPDNGGGERSASVGDGGRSADAERAGTNTADDAPDTSGGESGSATGNDAPGGAAVSADAPAASGGRRGGRVAPGTAGDTAAAATTTAQTTGGAAKADANVEVVKNDALAGRDVAVGRDRKEKQADVDEDAGDTFAEYQPEIRLGQKHPSALVETAAMAGVETPAAKFTAERLGELLHLKPESLKQLSDPQVMVTALSELRHRAKDALGKPLAFFVGDGTGVGKGREGASILANNWHNGNRRIIWVSADDTKLFDAAQRDLGNVDGWETAPNKEGRDGKTSIPMTSHAKIAATGIIPNADGVMMTSYTKLRNPARYKQLIAWAEQGTGAPLILFDEAHKAAGATPGDSQVKASQQGEAVVKIQDDLASARIVYMSATGADKLTNLGYMSRLGLWGPGAPFLSFNEFAGHVSKQGLAGMEMLARELKAQGSYLSRTLTFKHPDGTPIEYDEVNVDVHPEMQDQYDKAADAWAFAINKLDEFIKDETLNKKEVRTFRSQFWGAHQRFFKNLLTSFKGPEIISQIERALDEGMAPVISLDSTNEGAINAKVAEMGEDMELEDMDLTPKEYLRKFVDKYWPTQLWMEKLNEATGKDELMPVWQHRDTQEQYIGAQPKELEFEPVTDPKKIKIKEQMLANIGDLNVPLGVLNQILLHFGADNVAEISGRSTQLLKNVNTGKMEIKRRQKGRGFSSIQAFEQNEFNQGRRKIAIITRAGAAGIDLQAGTKFANQKQRLHIIAELGWQTKDEVQKLGRTHRSDQRIGPRYMLMSINVAGDKRFASALAANIAAMGAIGRGDRKAGGAGRLAEYDFNSIYGERALNAVVNGISPTDLERMSVSYDKLAEMPPAEKMKTFFNRIMVLPIEAQNRYYHQFEEIQRGMIEEAKARGTYGDAIEFLPALNVRVNKKETVYKDEQSGAESTFYDLERELESKKTTWDTLMERANRRRVAPAPGQPEGPPNYALYKHKKTGAIAHGVEYSKNDVITGSPSTWVEFTRPGRDHVVAPAHEVAGQYDKIKWKDDTLPPHLRDTVDDAFMKGKWDEAMAAEPPTRWVSTPIIAGLTFPINQRIHGTTKAVRVALPDGDRIVGLQLSQSGMNQTLRDLGVGKSIDAGSAFDVYHGATGLERGEAVSLAGGLSLKRGTFSGGDGVEITLAGGKDILDPVMRQRLLDMGAIEARPGGWGRKYFVPRDATAGPEMMEGLLKQYPVVDLPQSMKPKKKAKAEGEATPAVPLAINEPAAAPKPSTSQPLYMDLTGGLATYVVPKLYEAARKHFTKDMSVAIAYDEAMSHYIESPEGVDRDVALEDIRKQFGWKAGDERESRFRELAGKTIDFEDAIGKGLVDNKLISKEAFEENRGQHLRRIYAYYENPDAWMRTLEEKLKKDGIKPELVDAKMAAERSLYEKVTGKTPDDLQAGNGQGASMGRVGKKKFSERKADEDTRAFLGEIKLASTRVERGGTIATREIAKTKMNRTIARGLGVTAQRAAKIAELRRDALQTNSLPDGKEFRTPGERLFFQRPDLFAPVTVADGLKGAIGYQIPKQIHRELTAANQTPSKAAQVFGSAMTFWKIGKTVGGFPGAWAGNIMGNLLLSQREAMLPLYRPERYTQAVKSIKDKDYHWDLAGQVAEFPYEDFRLELPRRGASPTAMPYPQTPKERLRAGAQTVVNKAVDSYGGIDTVFKHALFIEKFEQARKMGMDQTMAAREAAAAVDRTYPNFRTGTPIRALRPTVQYLRRGWMPFISWDASALPLVARAFRDEPGRMALFPAVYFAYKRAVEDSRKQVMTDDEIEREDKSLPDYMKGRYTRMEGREPKYMDIQPANPAGNAVFADSPADLVFQRLNPILSTGYQLYMNRAFINDMPIAQPADTPGDKFAKSATFAAKAAAPTMLGYGLDRAREIATGVASNPIKESRPGRGGFTVRQKLGLGERSDKLVGEFTRMKTKTVDVERERTNRYYEAKNFLGNSKTVLRDKVTRFRAEHGRTPTKAELKLLAAPYVQQMKDKTDALPR